MSTARSQSLAAVGLVGMLVLGACTEPSSGTLVRVTVEGTREQQNLEVEDDGTVELEGDVALDRALLRLGALTVASDQDEGSLTQPVNIDLFQRTIVWEGTLAGERLDRLSFDVPAPVGDGVLRGVAISVYMSGLLYEEPFEYRDASMAPFELALTQPLDGTSRQIEVHVDLRNVFVELDEETLVAEPTGGFVLSEGANAAAAAQVEAALRAGISVATGPY